MAIEEVGAIEAVNRVIAALLPVVELDPDRRVHEEARIEAGRAICDAVALRETLKLNADPEPDPIGDLFNNREAPGEDDE